ncbi:TniB family NTP-binding protein [Siccirubricoccus sp. G192]|uniref:TniB family NTP-binding protein n=1 Tax=Siccirubricoccus sp. G192 TaxID=2849651 RepID=UPI001C2B8240|nr:TniB family NTP-binding protein [Siccirubricoccus sp. G192]MBV1800550.1 TniB family NTP-binding protein [Siccirubricoccus sp. G192]
MPATGESPHLPIDLRPIATLGNEDRIAHIRSERWIGHAAAERVLGYLQEAFDQPADSDDTSRGFRSKPAACSN